MCYIEFVKNPIELFEKNEAQNEKERRGLPSFWSWEQKLLKQEQDYFKNQIQSLESQIEVELEQVLTKDQDA